MASQPQKLNIFQRGILQKVATVIVYFASFAAGALILDWLEKRRFTVVAEKAQQQGILTPESFRNLKAQIAAMPPGAPNTDGIGEKFQKHQKTR